MREGEIMKVVQINVTAGEGSTGKICMAIGRELSNRGIENYLLYTSGNCAEPNAIKYANNLQIKQEALKARVYGNWGFNSKKITKDLISWLEQIQPDIIHLHNLHGHNVNLELLFDYIRQKKVRVIWTFHDSWAFTGYCTHFNMAKCERWKTGCMCCPQKKGYTWFTDRSSEIYKKKKELFCGLDLTIVTPSKWLAGLVKESFLKEYPVRVINNGIDLNVFKPSPSDFRERCGITGGGSVVSSS